ncbi:hypothetical protein ACS0TY_008450 [Phlomoides rotata]
MGRGNENQEELNSRKYGIPLYGAAWVPPAAGKEDSVTDSDSPATATAKRLIVFAGGGGEGHSGIPNALLLSAFDLESNSLSDKPVAKLGTGSDLPYRMAVHPGGEGLICSFSQSCRWFEWGSTSSNGEDVLSLKSSENVLEQLKDVGQQLAMTFNHEGSLLAVGGEDGKLRVFKWPSMEIILNEAPHPSVKDLNFSLDGKFLVSVGNGAGKIWNVETSTSVASLPKETGEILGYCQFSQTTGNDQVLYVTSMRGKDSRIVKFNTSWQRISTTCITRESVCAFNVSPDGKLLAIGTAEGNIIIISSTNLRVHTYVKKAHLGFVTASAFSLDSRALVSTSMDSSSRVTLIKDKKKDGMNLWIILLIIILAVAVYYAKTKELIPL